MLIGICGKSGSGKSTISRLIKEYYQDNVEILDIDKIGHEIYSNEEVIEKMINHFGSKILTNNMIDRKKLSTIVFQSKEEMNSLTDITWSHMEKIIDSFIDNNKNKIIILDWQLLPLTKFFQMCDFKVLLDIPYEIRKERTMKRDNISDEKFDEREKASIKYNKKEFDFLINNIDEIKIRKLVKKI